MFGRRELLGFFSNCSFIIFVVVACCFVVFVTWGSIFGISGNPQEMVKQEQASIANEAREFTKDTWDLARITSTMSGGFERDEYLFVSVSDPKIRKILSTNKDRDYANFKTFRLLQLHDKVTFEVNKSALKELPTYIPDAITSVLIPHIVLDQDIQKRTKAKS